MEAGVAEVGITGTGLPEPQLRRLFLGFNRPDGRWLLSDLRAIASQRMWVPRSTGGDRPHPLLFNLGPAFILICASSGCFITEWWQEALRGPSKSPRAPFSRVRVVALRARRSNFGTSSAALGGGVARDPRTGQDWCETWTPWRPGTGACSQVCTGRPKTHQACQMRVQMIQS